MYIPKLNMKHGEWYEEQNPRWGTTVFWSDEDRYVPPLLTSIRQQLLLLLKMFEGPCPLSLPLTSKYSDSLSTYQDFKMFEGPCPLAFPLPLAASKFSFSWCLRVPAPILTSSGALLSNPPAGASGPLGAVRQQLHSRDFPAAGHVQDRLCGALKLMGSLTPCSLGTWFTQVGSN